MAAESKPKKRKAPSAVPNAPKKVKQLVPSATATNATKKDASPIADALKPTQEPVPPLPRTSKRKQAADYFDDAPSDSEDTEWNQLKASKAKRSMATKALLPVSKKYQPKPPASARMSKATKEITMDLQVDTANTPGAETDASKAAKKSSARAKGQTMPKTPKVLKKTAHVAGEATSESEVERRTKELHVAKAPTETKNLQGKQVKGVAPDEDVSDDGTDEAEVGEDDQTAALLKGFESSGDDEDSSKEDSPKEGQAVPVLPNEKKVRKKLKDASRTGHDRPGVVYIGRIPHGFYEREMRAYFTQFGEILRLRLSRNRKTGCSKHYAFIEFASSEVARIVADTMDNYLMFGHILKCKLVPQEQVHVNLWKGANRRFKTIPHNKIEGRRLEVAISKDSWDRKINVETKRREEKATKLRAIGYEFAAPTLKRADDIEGKEESLLVVGGPDGEVLQEEAIALEKETPKTVVVSEGIISKKAGPAAMSKGMVDTKMSGDSANPARGADKTKVAKAKKSSKRGDVGSQAQS